MNSDDVDTRMPPPDSGKVLSAEDMATLKDWMEQRREVGAALGFCCAASGEGRS